MTVLRSLVPDFIRRRFSLKFASILMVMVLVVGLLGMTATGLVASEVEGNVEQEQRDLATQKANVVEKWVQRNTISVKLASKNDALAETGGKARYEMRSELATTAANLYGVNAIFLVDAPGDGMTVAASPQMRFGTAVANTSRSWLLDVALARMGVAEVYTSNVYKVEGRPVVSFVSPVQGIDDRYLVVEFDVRPLARSLQQTGSTSGFTQVVDENGTIQVAGRHGQILQPYGDAEAMAPVERARRLGETSDRSAGVIARMSPDEDVMDTEYTVAYAPVQVDNTDLDWVVLIHEPAGNVYGFPQAISLWGKLTTLAGVVFIGLLGGAVGFSTTRDVRELRRLAAEMRGGNLEVEISSPRIDSIGQLYDGFDEMRVELKRQIEEATRARAEAERSRAEAVRMSEYLQEKAEAYSETMGRCAAGDLTRRLEPDGENEAMDRIATDFNEMVGELERTIEQLKRFAEEVEGTGDSLQSTADSVKVSSEHVAESVHTISDDAWDQKDRLESLSRDIDELVALFEDLGDDPDAFDADPPLDRLDEIAGTVSSVADISEQTLAETEIVAGAAEEQTAELSEVSRRATELVEYARPLREVLGEFETMAGSAVDGERWRVDDPSGAARTDGTGPGDARTDEE